MTAQREWRGLLFVAPFLVLCFVLGGATVAWAGTDRCSPRCHVVSVRVVTGDANGAWAGTASAPNTPRHTRVRAKGVFPGARRLRSRMRFEPFARGTPRFSMRAPSRHFCQPVSCGVVLAYVSLEYKATLHIVAMHPR